MGSTAFVCVRLTENEVNRRSKQWLEAHWLRLTQTSYRRKLLINQNWPLFPSRDNWKYGTGGTKTLFFERAGAVAWVHSAVLENQPNTKWLIDGHKSFYLVTVSKIEKHQKLLKLIASGNSTRSNKWKFIGHPQFHRHCRFCYLNRKFCLFKYRSL